MAVFLRAVHFWGRGNQKVFGENRLKIAEIDCNRRFSENSPLVGRLGFRDPDSVSFQSLFLFIQTSWRAYPDTAPIRPCQGITFRTKMLT